MRSPTAAAVVMGTLWGLAAMGTSATSVVLGDLQDELQVGTTATAWVLTAFALAFAAATPVFGRVADSVGSRSPYILGVLLLAAGATVSAVATTLPVLLSGRVLQGIGAGAIPVLTSTILSTRFSEADRAVALGRVNSVVVVLSSIGPLIGGLLGVWVGWRGPVALPLLAVVLLPWTARLASRGGTGQRIDVVGATLVAGSAAALLTTVQTISRPVALTAVAAVALPVLVVMLVRHVRSRPDGFVPRTVVADAVIVRAAVAGAALPLVYFAGLVAVPLELSGQGWTPLDNGLLLLPGAVVGSAVSFNSARILGRLGRRRGAILGLSASGVGALVAVGTAWSPWLAGAGFLGLAVGYALAQPALVGAIAAAAPQDVRGAALGSFTLMFFVGAGLGSAVVGGLADLVTLSGTLAVALLAPVTAVVVLARARPHPAWAAPGGAVTTPVDR